MKKSYSFFSFVLFGTTFSVLQADASDRWAYLIDVTDTTNGNFTFLDPGDPGARDATHPDSGKIEEVEWRLQTDVNSPQSADYQNVHFVVTGNHDMLIPLGELSPGMFSLDYSITGNNAFFGGKINFSHKYVDPANDPGDAAQIHRHESSTPAGRIFLRSKVTSGGFKRNYWLVFNRNDAYAQSNLSTLSISLRGVGDVAENYGNVADAPTAGNVPVLVSTGRSLTAYEINQDLKVNGSSVLTESSLSSLTSFRMGPSSQATGTNAIGLGRAGIASGDYSIAMGYYAEATGEHAFAHGYNSYASGAQAFAANWSTAAGAGSVAMGRAISTGDYAISLGRGSEATGYNSVSLARGYSVGNWSIAGGRETTANSYAEIALGANNDAQPGNISVWDDADTLFTIGNGENHLAKSNAIMVMKNGQTILTNKYWNDQNPGSIPVDIKSADGEALVVEGHTRLKGRVVIEQPQGDVSMGIFGGSQ